MRLSQVKIENFRSIKEQVIHLDDYTCLVGPNGAGKSVVLMALNVFFQENASTTTDVRVLGEEDFHHKNKAQPVKITVTFEDLSETAQKEFSPYYRQGKLIIFAKAEWSAEIGGAPVKHYGSRHVMKEFAPFFQAEGEGKLVGDLREIYNGIRLVVPELPNATTKTAMKDALRTYEENHPEKCVLIDEANQFYGFTKGGYRLDNHVQWVYVPAVKDASTEQDEGTKTALGQLLARTVRTKLSFGEMIDGLKTDVEEKYAAILARQEQALADLALSMGERLKNYVNEHARLRLRWYYDPKTSVAIRDPIARADIGDAHFIGEVARSGHGMQRAFLLAILHELVGNEKQGSPTLLLGFEEPELYQHPPQAQHLADTLEKLARKENNAQVIVTTHSPYFVTARGFESIRMFHNCPKKHCSQVRWTTYEKVEERLSKALGEKPKSPTSLMAVVNQIMNPSQKELFFTPMAVIVEGPEDVAFISTHLKLAGTWNLFRALGCHFIMSGGKDNMPRLVAIAKDLGIHVFLVFDSDSVTLQKQVDTTSGNPEKNKGAKANLERNVQVNSCLLDLCGIPNTKPSIETTFWGGDVAMWTDNILSTVVGDFGEETWRMAEERARVEHGLVHGVRQKNAMLIAATLERLRAEKKQSASLIKLCAGILHSAEKLTV